MKRGVAPDHVPRIAMLTVLASLDIKLGGDRKRGVSVWLNKYRIFRKRY